MLLKLKLLTIFLLIFIFLPSGLCLAAGEFSSSYDFNYDVSENGITKVTQNVALTNLTSDYRASSYSLTLKTPHVDNITAGDKTGPLKVEVKQDDSQTAINVKFGEIVVGNGKILNWTLSYETTEYASKNGLVWEINLPGLPKEDNITGYTVVLNIPASFGPALYFSPQPQKNYVWTKNDIGSGGIQGAFGKYQLFDFYLKYQLSNTKNYPISTEIALPPDFPYQKIVYKDISPKPLETKIDYDGNFLAVYNLNINQKLTIKVTGQAKLFIEPQENSPLTSRQKQQYLSPQKYWETEDPVIKNLASTLKTPEAIYDYLVNNLTYDYQKIDRDTIKRLGAKDVLQHKDQAICMEFTDLFIALSRAAGIPAREIDGFAYTTNTKLRPIFLQRDILHSWPEYYDQIKNSWVPIDPTWGNTTNGVDYFHRLDLNHFAFVIKGQHSEYPIPAGSYKDSGDGKDIDVVLAQEEYIPKMEKPKVIIKSPASFISGLSYSTVIQIENLSGQTVDYQNIQLRTPNLQRDLSEFPKNIRLLPFSRKEIIIPFKPASFWEKSNGKIIFVLDKEVTSKDILIRPIIFDKMFQLTIGGVIGAIAIFAIAGKARRLYLQKRKRADSLYREGQQPQK